MTQKFSRLSFFVFRRFFDENGVLTLEMKRSIHSCKIRNIFWRIKIFLNVNIFSDSWVFLKVLITAWCDSRLKKLRRRLLTVLPYHYFTVCSLRLRRCRVRMYSYTYRLIFLFNLPSASPLINLPSSQLADCISD